MKTFDRFEAGWHRARLAKWDICTRPHPWLHTESYMKGYDAGCLFRDTYIAVPESLEHEEICRRYILYMFEDLVYKPWFPTKGLKEYLRPVRETPLWVD